MAFACSSRNVLLHVRDLALRKSPSTLLLNHYYLSKCATVCNARLLVNSNSNSKRWYCQENKEKKQSLYQRVKQMYKEYWYVLLPVHAVTSAAWFGCFYYVAISGVDIVGLLESWGASSTVVKPFKDSSLGYLAVAFGLYKMASPLRYMVTLGGTTISIKYLKEYGYIKPVPSKEQFKAMLVEKKETLRQKKENLLDDLVKKGKGGGN